jgi:hypothetical protein
MGRPRFRLLCAELLALAPPSEGRGIGEPVGRCVRGGLGQDDLVHVATARELRTEHRLVECGEV